MDRLMAFKVFKTVIERGSFTAAGAHLDITRSMVSRHVMGLEKWLGTRLLQRSTRSLSLTSAGEGLLNEVSKVLEIVEGIEQTVGGQSKEPEGVLKVTCAISMGHALLVPMLHRFLAEHKKVKIDVVVTDRSVNLIEEGIDLSIALTNTLEPNSIARRLSTVRAVVAASPKYLSENVVPTNVNDLKKLNCLGHSFHESTVWHFLDKQKDVQVEVSGNFKVNDATSLLAAAQHGVGVALLPYYLAKPLFESGELVRIFPELEAKPLGVYGVFHSRKYVPAAVTALLTFLKKELAGLDL